MSLEIVVGVITAAVSTLLGLYIKFSETRTKSRIEEMKALAETEKSLADERLKQEEEWRTAEEKFRATLLEQIEVFKETIKTKDEEIILLKETIADFIEKTDKLQKDISLMRREITDLKKRLSKHEAVNET